MAPILAYWDLRGLANPIRMLLAYADVRYEDKRYSLKDEAAINEWITKDKVQLMGTLDFPNLPYYIDGMVQMSQSRAILQYLGKKHGLNGNTEQETVRILVITEQIEDMKQALIKIAYPLYPLKTVGESVLKQIHEDMKAAYVSSLDEKLEAISAFLGENDWMAGQKLTYVDFFVYDVLDWNRVLFGSGKLDGFQNLKTYMQRFEALKGVKNYLGDKDKFVRLPVFSPFAMMGHTSD